MKQRLCFAAATVLVFSVFIATVVGSGFRSHSRLENKPEPSDAMRALDFWTQPRAYPDVDLPPDRYFRAFELMKRSMREARTGLTTAQQWQFMGPTNVVGRTTSVAFNPRNPNTLYAGGAAGGLWRSSTAGLGGDWQRIKTGFPVSGVRTIAIDPVDTSTMYIGTGETYGYRVSTGGIVTRTTRGSYGIGILKTTNGGATWTKSLDWTYNQQRGVQMIRVNPVNRRTIIAATSEGVYRSVDAGATWSNTLNVLMAQDIAIKPDDTTLVLATCGNFGSPGNGVYRSTNGGATFTGTSGLPNFSGMAMMDVYLAHPEVVYLILPDSTEGTGGVWRTTDFGISWTQINNQTRSDVQGWYSQFVAVHPTDSSRIVRGAQDIYKSINGGRTFSSSNTGTWADFHYYAHDPTNPDILYIVDDGGVYRSTDYGSTYQSVSGGMVTTQFYNGFSSSATDSLFAMGQVQDHFGWIFRGSNAWEYHRGDMDEIGWTAINQTNDLIVYAGNRGGGTVNKSTNRGSTFFSLSTGFSGLSAWNAPFVLSPSNPNVLYFGRSRIYKTTNAGTSWFVTNGGQVLDGNPALSMAVAFTNPDTAFVGTAPFSTRAKIFRTTNGGTSWADVTGTLPNRYPMDITFDPSNSSTVYAAFGGFDTTRIAKSTNCGETWTDITGALPNVPTTAVAVDPSTPRHVYVGNDLGVFVSTNGGGDWQGFNDGLPEAVIAADLVVSRSNNSLRVATHSAGVYQRTLLSALTWAVPEHSHGPKAFSLMQNYPNPFNPETRIRFTLDRSQVVRLVVYDVRGKEVVTLAHERLPAGTHDRSFGGGGLASGVYLYRLEAEGTALTRKAVLMK